VSYLPNRSAKTSAVDFVGVDFLVERLADCLIEPVEQIDQGLPFAPQQSGQHDAFVSSDCGTRNRWDIAARHVSAVVDQSFNVGLRCGRIVGQTFAAPLEQLIGIDAMLAGDPRH